MYRLCMQLKEESPRLQFGHHNRTRENFSHPPGFDATGHSRPSWASGGRGTTTAPAG